MTVRSPRGFSLVELLVVVTLVAVLAAILLDRILLYQEQAEKVAAEQVIAAVRSGLQMQFASRLLSEDRSGIKGIFEGNPIDILIDPPSNYGGIISGGGQSPEVPKKGSWYFDKERRELVYYPKLSSNLASENVEKVLRFRVEGSGELAGRGNMGFGIRLTTVIPYQWF